MSMMCSGTSFLSFLVSAPPHWGGNVRRETTAMIATLSPLLQEQETSAFVETPVLLPFFNRPPLRLP